jgi:hypothetical protein
MRKHRGLKRYYKNLYIKNISEFELDKAAQEWFYLMHIHFDNRGYGNNSFKKRKPHLDKLMKQYDLLSEDVKHLKTDYQIWATILDYDSQSDALFLHTPNPDHDSFPHKIKNLSENNNLTNAALANYINNLSGFKVLFGQAGENYVVLFKEEFGVGLI